MAGSPGTPRREPGGQYTIGILWRGTQDVGPAAQRKKTGAMPIAPFQSLPGKNVQKGGGKQEKNPLGREKPRWAGREVPVLCEIDVIVNLLTGDLQY